ncbi:TolC family protein [Zunongwangia pacifica]|uniref:TolC family protein n=1 Tax=Zunongwangia pacifica TaxID=2911062 RepID=A0A9X2CR45_9FLAO|nr:TolC family protein [Zunongwangia pacifica]MCL6220893.1 TolC family protein [Zunongwangia pacifica]
MKEYKKSLLLLGVLLNNFLIANAQESKELSLKEALNYALSHKAEVKKAQLAISKSEYQIQEKKAEILPTVALDGNLINNPILQETALPGEILGEPGTVVMAPLGQKWNADGGINLTQKLFDQSVFIGLKAARSSREFYQINLQLTEENVIEKVASQYYHTLILQANLTAVDTTYQNTVKIQQIIKSQFENGLAKGIDVKRIQVRVANLQAQQQELQNSIQISKNTLKFLTGLPMEMMIILTEESSPLLPQIEKETFNVSSLNSYQSLTKEKELRNYALQESKAANYPTLGLSAQYHYQGLGDTFPIGKNESQQVYWTDYSSITLNLHIPIFSGLKTRAKVRQAQLDVETLQLDIEDKELSLRADFENAKNQIRTSEITIENQQQNVVLAKEVVEDIQNNYTNGLAPLTDVLDAETSLIEAQNNYNKAVLDYRLAQLDYLKSKGELHTLLK